jgi:hypothetical protein
MQVSNLKGFHLRGCVREQYKSYPENSLKSLSFWVEIVLW